MEFQYINLKIYAHQQEPPALEKFVPVFHNWIQQEKLGELLIDVADYSHVPAGPGVLLIAHEANYSVEFGPEERFGLLYNNKKLQNGSNQERLHKALQRTLTAARLLEDDERFAGTLAFSPANLIFTVNRRNVLPNTDDAYQQALAELKAVFDVYFGAGYYEISKESKDPRHRFTVRVDSEIDISLSAMLARNAEYFSSKN